jgi:hypothetical protein
MTAVMTSIFIHVLGGVSHPLFLPRNHPSSPRHAKKIIISEKESKPPEFVTVATRIRDAPPVSWSA